MAGASKLCPGGEALQGLGSAACPRHLEPKLEPDRRHQVVVGARTVRRDRAGSTAAEQVIPQGEESANSPQLSETKAQSCARVPEPVIHSTIPEAAEPDGRFESP